MPVIAPLIGALLPAIIGGTELGLSLSGAGQPSQGAAEKQLQQQEQQQAQADALARQRAIQAALPNAQEQGGGALNQPSLLNLGSVIAGLPGETNTPSGQNALAAFLGTGQPGAASTTPSGENLVSATYGISGSQG